MDHNKKTLCEKIAEGFVISFLIALLVVPCDLFQPTMWAAPVALPNQNQVYAFDYPYSNIAESESYDYTESEEVTAAKPTEANPTTSPTTSGKTRKAGSTTARPSKKADAAAAHRPQNSDKDKAQSSPKDAVKGSPKDAVKDTEGYLINEDPVKSLPDEFPVNADQVNPNSAIQESEILASGDSLKIIPVDTISILQSAETKLALDSLKAVTGDSISNAFVADSLKNLDPLKQFNAWIPRELDFNPDPTRAVWLSALFPGLGQIYNRRYWKLPIVVGAYMGLAYATSWNNTMLGDYTRAYRDIMDTDPSTNSYMDFFPPTVDEASLDKTWLKNILYSRKNYFRRYRDLCIILMVGVYLLAMVDAYVDASLAHFDISQDLSLDWSPAVFHDGFAKWPSVGVSWAFNF